MRTTNKIVDLNRTILSSLFADYGLFEPDHKRSRSYSLAMNQEYIRRYNFDLSDLGLRYSYFDRLFGQTNDDCLVDRDSD
jgi:hypothetical protein